MIYKGESKKANAVPFNVLCSLLDEYNEVEANPIKDSKVVF